MVRFLVRVSFSSTIILRHVCFIVNNKSENKQNKSVFSFFRYNIYKGGSEMKKPKGRPSVKYRTVQVRLDDETASILKKLSGLSGMGLPEAMREWLLPLARAELARRLGVESKNLERASSGK
jgi:hypothetical protein